jgi:hypothetical protein
MNRSAKPLLIAGILAIISAGCFLFYAFKSPQVLPKAFTRVVKYKLHHDSKNKVITGREGWLFWQPELEYVIDPLPPDNVKSIVEFDSTLRTHGMALFVVPIPNKIDIYPEKLTLLPAPHPVKKARLELIRQLELAGVRVIDLVPAFEAAKKRCRVFDAFETHWTAAGIEVAAGVIAQRIDSALRSRGISQSEVYSVCDTVLYTHGDLLDKIHGDEKYTWYPFQVKRVLCADGSLFGDDRKSEILILGDSFVDHGRWWNANLSAQLSRLLRHPCRTYFSLLANTEGPCMYQHKPSVFPENGIVIWAFTSRVLQYHLGCPKSDSLASHPPAQ